MFLCSSYGTDESCIRVLTSDRFTTYSVPVSRWRSVCLRCKLLRDGQWVGEAQGNMLFPKAEEEVESEVVIQIFSGRTIHWSLCTDPHCVTAYKTNISMKATCPAHRYILDFTICTVPCDLYGPWSFSLKVSAVNVMLFLTCAWLFPKY